MNEPDAAELHEVWSALEAAHESTPASSERTDAAWDALSAKLGLAADRDTPERPSVRGATARAENNLRSFRSPWLRVAATVTLLVGGMAVWQQIPVTYAASPGERLSVTLPDGSAVDLNAGSTLKHRRGFDFLPGVASGSRAVHLEGEAFFDVMSRDRPFEVVAGSARVTVLGTRFNVRARTAPDAPPVVQVDVEEGRVRVAAADTATELGPGASVRVEEGSGDLTPSTISTDRIASWRTGGLTVDDETLSVVVSEIGIRFGVEVALAPDVDGTVRLTAFYPLLSAVDSVLSDLATQQGLRVRQTSVGWELF
jgi:transmembrane sensor